jgi:hypothetical protein
MQTGIGQFEAERIIDALRAGLVPPSNLDEICVGRERWLDSIQHDIQFIAKGASKVRFVSAPWGGGHQIGLQ